VNARYQAWLKHVFDHEVKDQYWYYGEDAPEFAASPDEIVELLGRTFRFAGQDLKRFSDGQVDQGFWYLAGASSDYIRELTLANVPLEKRLAAIDGIYHLYADCFAKRCAETMGHLSEEGSPLNSICYMFWDICQLTWGFDCREKEIQAAVVNVLEKSLAIKHRACQEGALHGLGEIAHACPVKVREIVDRFLAETNLDEQLRAYALKAREGRVL